MTDTKRHPAAYSGGQSTSALSAAPKIALTLSEAATHEKQKAVSHPHPAHGCSTKHTGEVKRVVADNNGERSPKSKYR